MHDWICYVIWAVVDGRVRVYVGKTNDMHRRLRQHRGEIVGGAKETSRLRQRGAFWQLAATNWGFRSEREALVFEAQLQEPHKRRLLRDRQDDLCYMKEFPRTLYNAHLLCETSEFGHVHVRVHDTSPHPELEYPISPFNVKPSPPPSKPIPPPEKRAPTKKISSIDARIAKYKQLREHYIAQLQ
jgi:predicted GIY-YIG superfamily endonuclease